MKGEIRSINIFSLNIIARFRNSSYLSFVLEKLIKRRYQQAMHKINRFIKETKAEKIKIAAKLALSSSSLLKHYFKLWSFRAQDLTQKARAVQLRKLITILNGSISDNMKLIYNLPKELEQKRKSLRYFNLNYNSPLRLLTSFRWIFTNFDNMKKRAFYIWAMRSLKRKLQGELNLGLRLKKTDQLAFKLDIMYRNAIKDAFGCISRNMREHKLRVRAILCMQRTVFDQLRNAFLTWRNYNYRLKDENCKKIFFSLRDLRWKHLLWGFSGLRDEFLRKHNLMRKAIKKMEISTVSTTKFYLYRWKKATEVLRLFDKLKKTIKLFKVINEGLKVSTEPLFHSALVKEKKLNSLK